MKCKLWLDSKTNLPVGRRMEVRRDGELLLETTEIYTQWELEPKLPKDSFALPN